MVFSTREVPDVFPGGILKLFGCFVIAFDAKVWKLQWFFRVFP